MTALSIPTTASTGPLFDLPPISAAAPQVAQQAAAPFSDLLQQAQSPPPTPPQSPPLAAGNPPQQDSQRPAARPSDPSGADRAPRDSTTDTSTSTGDNAQAAGQPSVSDQTDASTVDSHGQSQHNQSTPSAHHAKASAQVNTPQQAAKNGAPGKGSSGKPAGADGRQKGDVTADATTAHASVAAQTVAAIKSDSAGKQSKDDSHQSPKAAESKPTPDGAAQSANVSLPDAAAQPAAPIVVELPAAISAPASSSADDQPASAAKSPVDGKQLASTLGAVAGQRQLQPVAAANQTKSKPQAPPKVSPPDSATANEAQRAVQNSSTLAVPASSSGKSANPSSLTSQTDTSANDAAAVNTLTAATVQAVATVAVNQAEVVSTITVDQAKPGDPTIAQVGADSAPPPAPTSPSSLSQATPAANPSPLAASLSHGSPAESSAGNGLSTLDRSRFVQRVTRAFQTVGDQGGQIRLRLSPPELGSLQVQISVKQGALTAHIQADNSTAQQVLLDSLPELRDRLSQQDIRIERFDVELSGQSSGGLPQSPQGNAGFDQNDRRLNPVRNEPSSVIPTDNAETAVAAPLSVSGALNVVV